MSRNPTSDMWSVRGIGVALMVSTSTLCLSCLMRSLWRTPKRCSSSTTSRPRSRNWTSLESSRCVPITMSTFPSANPASTSAISFLSRKRLNISTCMGNGANRRLSFIVLEGQHRGRGENRYLLAISQRLERRAHRDFGLAVTHVAAQQPVHRMPAFHIFLDPLDGRVLVLSLAKFERILEFALPVAVV